jgi:hypothetical protein
MTGAHVTGAKEADCLICGSREKRWRVRIRLRDVEVIRWKHRGKEQTGNGQHPEQPPQSLAWISVQITPQKCQARHVSQAGEERFPNHDLPTERQKKLKEGRLRTNDTSKARNAAGRSH